MDRSLLFARGALFIALISAFEIYGQTKDSRSVSMVVIAFFAALFWRDWRFGSYDLFGDLSQERVKSNRSSVFVFGSRIESSKPEVQERDVLLDEELLRFRTQSIAGFWGVIAAFGALMHWRFGVFPYSGTVLVAFLICFPLSFATHYSQQLIPLFLSLLAVIISLWKNELPSKTLLVIYVLSSFAMIAFLQNIRLNFASKAFGSSAWLQEVLKRALVAGVGFCVLVYAVTKLLPERHAAEAIQPEAKSETRQKAIEAVAKQIAKFERPQPGPKPEPQPKPKPGPGPFPKGNEKPSSVAKEDTRPQPNPAEQEHPDGERLDKGHAQPNGQNFDPEALKKLMAMKKPTGGKGGEAKEPSEGRGGMDSEPKDGNENNHATDESIGKELSKKTPEELESLQQQLDQEIAKEEQALKHPEQATSAPSQSQTNPGAPNDSIKPEDLAKLQKELANQDPKGALAQLEKLRDMKKQVDQASREKPATTGNEKLTGLSKLPVSGKQPGTGKLPGDGNDKTADGKPDSTIGEKNDPSHSSTASAKDNAPNVPASNVNVNKNVNVNAKRPPTASAEKPPAPPQGDETKESDRVKEIAQALDKKLERIESLVPYVVFGLIGLAFGLSVVKWMRRSKQKEVVLTLTEEEKKELSDELKSIRERKLTPQQEIIETYNVMMDVLGRVQLGREEGRPARVHAIDLKKRLPKIGTSVYEATDGFDAALYGDVDPAGDQLAKFRKSTKSVFKQFDIAA